jgi:hypothetical protein
MLAVWLPGCLFHCRLLSPPPLSSLMPKCFCECRPAPPAAMDDGLDRYRAGRKVNGTAPMSVMSPSPTIITRLYEALGCPSMSGKCESGRGRYPLNPEMQPTNLFELEATPAAGNHVSWGGISSGHRVTARWGIGTRLMDNIFGKLVVGVVRVYFERVSGPWCKTSTERYICPPRK